MIKMLNKLGEKIKKSPFLMGVLQDPKKKVIAAIVITIPIYIIYRLIDHYIINPDVWAEVTIVEEALNTVANHLL